MDTPEPPTDVRIVRVDGTEIPCEVRYEGTRTKDGQLMHDWVAVSEYVVDLRAGDSLAIGKLPARTSVSYPVRNL